MLKELYVEDEGEGVVDEKDKDREVEEKKEEERNEEIILMEKK